MVKGPGDVPVGGAPTSSASDSLFRRLRAREGAAWHRLVRLYGPVVYGWCRRAGLQEADAADVGQEVFAAVAGGIDAFRRDRPGDSFRGWLWGITRHKVNDLWRRRAGQPDGAGGSGAQQLA
jgi:RNA polymerase sigma-70 factor (ECF subfamily)